MYMTTLGRLRFLSAYATPSLYPEAESLQACLSALVTKLGKESGSMTSAMAVFGLALMIVTIAISVSGPALTPIKVSPELTINVLGLVPGEGADRKLSVGGLGGAITTRQIVNDETDDSVARNSLDHFIDDRNLGDGIAGENQQPFSQCTGAGMPKNVHPHESSNFCDLGSRSSEARVRNSCGSGNDLIGVELVGIELARGESVAAEGDSRGTCSRLKPRRSSQSP
jgi:hypothetical protein